VHQLGTNRAPRLPRGSKTSPFYGDLAKQNGDLTKHGENMGFNQPKL
jgi:hypothetical protein